MIPSNFFAIDQQGPVVRMMLNRPDKANCLDSTFWMELPTVLRELNRDPSVRTVVMAGEGRHFSAGMDLSAFDFIGQLTTAEPGRAAFGFREEILRLQDALNALEEVRFPIIAVAHGACIGGALDLLSACDIRMASVDAQFSIEEVNVGMAADVGTLQRLPRLVSPGIVKELAFTGRRFGADEARHWGFVNAVHADKDAALVAALALADEISRKSPLAIAGIKRTVNYARDHSIADGLDQIATWNAGMLRPEDITRSMQALQERKPAEFIDLPRIDPAGPPTLPPCPPRDDND
jgi:enoyl-CoA hydratase